MSAVDGTSGAGLARSKHCRVYRRYPRAADSCWLAPPWRRRGAASRSRRTRQRGLARQLVRLQLLLLSERGKGWSWRRACPSTTGCCACLPSPSVAEPNTAIPSRRNLRFSTQGVEEPATLAPPEARSGQTTPDFPNTPPETPAWGSPSGTQGARTPGQSPGPRQSPRPHHRAGGLPPRSEEHSPGCTTQRTRESPSWRKRQRKRLKPSCECQPTSPKRPPPSPPPSSLQPPLSQVPRGLPRGYLSPYRFLQSTSACLLGTGPGDGDQSTAAAHLGYKPWRCRGIGAARSFWHVCFLSPSSSPTAAPAKQGLDSQKVILNQREGRGCILGTTPLRCTALLAWVLQHREFTVTKDWVSFFNQSLIASATSHCTEGCDTFFFFTLFFTHRCASKTGIGQPEGDSQPTRRTRVHLGPITFEVHWSSRLGSTTQGVHCHQRRSFIPEARRTKVHLGHNTWRCTALLAWVLQDGEFTVTNNWVSFLTKVGLHLQRHIAPKVVTFSFSPFFFTQRCASNPEIGQQEGDCQPPRRTREHLGHNTFEVHCSSRLGTTTQGVHRHQRLRFTLELQFDCTCNVTSHRRLWRLPSTHLFLSLTAAPQRKKDSRQPVVLQLGDFCLSLGEVCWRPKKKKPWQRTRRRVL